MYLLFQYGKWLLATMNTNQLCLVLVFLLDAVLCWTLNDFYEQLLQAEKENESKYLVFKDACVFSANNLVEILFGRIKCMF